jgi:hypothetical protein
MTDRNATTAATVTVTTSAMTPGMDAAAWQAATQWMLAHLVDQGLVGADDLAGRTVRLHLVDCCIDGSTGRPLRDGTLGLHSRRGDSAHKVQVKVRGRSLDSMLATLAHELVHVAQYASGRLQQEFKQGPRGGRAKWRRYWHGKFCSARYWDMPWEIEARAHQDAVRDAYQAAQAAPATPTHHPAQLRALLMTGYSVADAAAACGVSDQAALDAYRAVRAMGLLPR